MAEPYKNFISDKGKREPEELSEEQKVEEERKKAAEEQSKEPEELSRTIDKSKEEPSKGEAKKSPAEEEKSGELIGEQPTSQAEEILSEPILVPRNPLALISRTIIIMFFVDSGLAVVLLILASLPDLTSRFLFAAAAVLLVIKTLLLGGVIIRASTAWTQHSYYLTERQLIHRQGIVSVEEKVYELDNIRHVKLMQDIIGRQFDFGHLELLIATAGLTETIRLNDLKNPEHFKNVFSNYLG